MITIKGITYSSKEISEMNTQGLKALISFIDKKEDLKLIRACCKSFVVENYIQELLNKSIEQK